MKPKDIDLNIHEITRLDKKNCDNIRQKISEKNKDTPKMNSATFNV